MGFNRRGSGFGIWDSARDSGRNALAIACVVLLPVATVAAQAPPGTTAPTSPVVTDYVVGPQDVLTITSYDQNDLSGRFSVEADGTFTYPLIGRVKAGGLTLRQVEAQVKKQLKDGGFFNNPQITVAVDQYKSQKIFINGEVRVPGTYPLSGNMNLVEALARAGSTLPTANGEVVIVHRESDKASSEPLKDDSPNIGRVSTRDLENGVFSQH